MSMICKVHDTCQHNRPVSTLIQNNHMHYSIGYTVTPLFLFIIKCKTSYIHVNIVVSVK